MLSLFKQIAAAVSEDFGVPTTLRRLVAERGADLRVEWVEPPRTVAKESVVPWHRWSHPSHLLWPRRQEGEVLGWRQSAGHYRSYRTTLDALKGLGRTRTTRAWSCDIQDVDGLSNSKSNLNDFTTLDDMVERNSRALIAEIDESRLNQNLAHKEIRIIHNARTSDHFVRHLWDGRLFLVNDGGSHHFAAARYIAARLNCPVPLVGDLYIYEIDDTSVLELTSAYELFVISGQDVIGSAFHDVMCSFNATYLWHDMPRLHGDSKTIFLPRTEVRSMRVAKELRKAEFFDLGQHLVRLCERQKEIDHLLLHPP